MRNIQHFHVFHDRIAGERHPFATVAVGIDEANQTRIAVAVCSNKDNFSRRTGAAIARGRLQSNQSEVITADFDSTTALIEVFAMSDNVKSSKRNPNVAHADFATAFKTLTSVINEVNGIKG